MVDVCVMRKAIQPGQEWAALPSIPTDRLPGFEEHLFGEILGLRVASGTKVQIPVHPFDETIV
jgi:hypothetical protein